jgi:[citrate (pro-3S)-lyase] ligase
MKDILPKHGIEFLVFQRKEFAGIPISASIVRELVKDGKYDDIKNLVPESTYEFLMDRKRELSTQGQISS